MVDHVRVLSASFAAAAIGALVAMQANAAPVDTAADTANRALGLPSILIPWTTDRAGGPMTGPPGVIPQPTPAKPGLVLGASLGELYTDNLTLAGSGQPKQSSWITTFEPFVRGAAATPRFTGLFDYSATGYLYAGQPSDNQVAQDFRGQGSLVVVPDHLFIDGAATYGRELVNNALSSQSGTFFLDNNQSNVTTGSLSPYWTQEVGDLGRMTLRYTHGRVIYNDHGIPDESSALLDGVSNVSSDGAQFSFVSPKDRTFGWNLGYTDQWLEPDFGRGTRFTVAKLGVSLQVSQNLQLLADVGRENRFLSDGSYKVLDAWLGDVGFAWATSRDDFQALVGHRFYGTSGNVSWTHTAARLTTVLSYVEQPTDLNQQLLGANPALQVLSPVAATAIPSLNEQQVYLMKRASAAASYKTPRGTIGLSLYDESRRYFTLGNAREHVDNADLSWHYELGPFTTLTPDVGWQRYAFLTGQVTHLYFLQLSLVHQINAADFASIKVRHDFQSVRSPIPGAGGYVANVAYLQWTHLF